MSRRAIPGAATRVRIVRLRTLVIVLWLVVGLLMLSSYSWKVYDGPPPVGHWGGMPMVPAENG